METPKKAPLKNQIQKRYANTLSPMSFTHFDTME